MIFDWAWYLATVWLGDDVITEDSHVTKASLGFPPNVSDEWLVPVLRIREVLGSNLGPDTGHHENEVFVVLLSFPRHRRCP
jgi:hypothetical protein